MTELVLAWGDVLNDDRTWDYVKTTIDNFFWHLMPNARKNSWELVERDILHTSVMTELMPFLQVHEREDTGEVDVLTKGASF